jgi:hypothetical protein
MVNSFVELFGCDFYDFISDGVKDRNINDSVIINSVGKFSVLRINGIIVHVDEESFVRGFG